MKIQENLTLFVAVVVSLFASETIYLAVSALLFRLNCQHPGVGTYLNQN